MLDWSQTITWTDCWFIHDDVIKWRHFPRYWPFVRGIHWSLVKSPHKGQWRGALIFSFDLRLNKRLSNNSWGWWFETLSCPLWRQCNVLACPGTYLIKITIKVQQFAWEKINLKILSAKMGPFCLVFNVFVFTVYSLSTDIIAYVFICDACFQYVFVFYHWILVVLW